MSLHQWKRVTGAYTNPGVDFTDVPPYVSQAGAYWFAVTSGNNAGLSLRHSRTARGPFVEATLPAEPTGYDLYNGVMTKGVVHGNGTYAFLVAYYDEPATIKYRILHATDPAGTWTSYEWDATDAYKCYCFAYLDGKFIIGGYYDDGASPYPAFIATCATVNGAYTINTSTATTGYDVSVLTGSPAFWYVSDIDFDGTDWVTIGYKQSGVSGNELRTSTSLTSGWAAPSSPPATGMKTVRAHDNDWWTIPHNNGSVYYTDTPSGTWTALGTAASQLTTSVEDVAYSDGTWVLVGAAASLPAITYAAGTGTPNLTYAAAVAGFNAAGDPYAYSVDGSGGAFVAGGPWFGEVRTTEGATFLRQHQSPVYAPSRVRPVQLRNRQTTMIR